MSLSRSTPSLTDTDFERGARKRQQDEMRRYYIQQKGYQIIEMWECEWWRLSNTDASVKSHLQENFPDRQPLSEEELMQRIIDGKHFGYVKCDFDCRNTSAITFQFSSLIQKYCCE